MNPRRLWTLGATVLVAVVAVAVFAPAWRLERERAAARKEGLALSREELRPNPPVPEADNAAPLVRVAREGWMRTGAYRRGLPILKEDARVIGGTGNAKDRADVLAWTRRTAPNLAQWRAASRKPRVDYGDRASFRWSEWGLDLIEDRYAAASLVAAAAVGVDVQDDLLAAARLSALMRSEGEIHAASRGALLGIECLTVARRVGLVPEVAAALGPPTDLRATLRPELPKLLEIIDEIQRDGMRDRNSLWGWFDRLSRDHGAARLSAIRRWRDLWRALPSDPSDYGGTVRVVDARVPPMMSLTLIDGSPLGHPMPGFRLQLGGTGKDVGASLRDVARFEAMRRSLIQRR